MQLWTFAYWGLIVGSILNITQGNLDKEPQWVWQDSLASFDASHWQKATHTFKNNLAQFRPNNIYFGRDGLQLWTKVEKTKYRKYTAGEYRSLGYYHYGTFSVKAKLVKKSGLVTGFFLYDDSKSPHHEIDIEFLGKDCTKIFLNYWDDAEKEHPVCLPLDFDATKEFHEYTIEWMPTYIKWLVDGKEIYQVQENIPDKPQKIMMNSWLSPHQDWAGKLTSRNFPTKVYFKDFKYALK